MSRTRLAIATAIVSFLSICFLDTAAEAQPDRYLLINPPPPHVIRVQPYVPPVIVPPPVVYHPVPVVVAPPRPNLYPNDAHFILGTGMGGLGVFFNDQENFVATYRLQFGVAVGPAQFEMNVEFAPNALEISEGNEANVNTVGTMFAYRFAENCPVHPIVGLGIEALFLNPDQGSTVTGFAGTGRLGFEFAFPVGTGALALGIDGRAHRMFANTGENFPRTMNLLSFGAYANYRF